MNRIGSQRHKEKHVSGNDVPIIRRNYCISATPGIRHSVCMAVWYAGWDKLPEGNPNTVTNTRCRTDTVISLDNGHLVA
jgi:hypothetical protein